MNAAVFVDFENLYLSLKSRNDNTGIRTRELSLQILEGMLARLREKGHPMVVGRSYAAFDNYPGVEVAHDLALMGLDPQYVLISHSGKNSADIRMVVDALDLCYTKEHINTFVIISGDSDFSPLVSKLRENAKTVIGVGVKQSTSDLLISNCDEFIFYDDLAERRSSGKARSGKQPRSAKKSKSAKKKTSATKDDPAQQAIDLVIETTEALYAERGDRDKLWGSMIKQTLKRRKPGFSESVYGFSSFSDLLEEAAKRKQLELERDEKSGGYIVRGIRK